MMEIYYGDTTKSQGPVKDFCDRLDIPYPVTWGELESIRKRMGQVGY